MTWFSPLMGSTKAQRDACWNLYMKQKESGRVIENHWDPSPPENPQHTSRAKFGTRKPQFFGARKNDPVGLKAEAIKLKNKLSSREISDKLGVSGRTIRRWLSGA